MTHLLLFLLLVTGGSNTEMNYTGSTPANNTVRDFLAISQIDSIDFIRWKLKVTADKSFELLCSYGIGKANTNGFVNEQKVQMKGGAAREDGRLILKSGTKTLPMLIVTPNILHILNTNGTLMVGNGGWSYTLNALQPIAAAAIQLKPKAVGFADSIVFDGRTPCRGIEELMENKTRPECYKKKWRITLYKAAAPATYGTYKIGVADARTGTWKIREHKTGRPVYVLDLNNGNSLNLFQADEHIVYIMDKEGSLMVGDHDFSYSLNKKG